MPIVHCNAVVAEHRGDLPDNGRPARFNTVPWELTVVLDYYEGMGTYGRIGLLRRYWELTVVLDYYEGMGTYSCIGLLRGYWELTVVLDYCEAMGNLQSYLTTTTLLGTYSRIELPGEY